MLSQRFLLNTATIAIASEGGEAWLLHVPEGAEIVVTDSLDDGGPANRPVSAQWQGRVLKMFATDILERGQPCSDAGRQHVQ